jgi:hypothetical protein
MTGMFGDSDGEDDLDDDFFLREPESLDDYEQEQHLAQEDVNYAFSRYWEEEDALDERFDLQDEELEERYERDLKISDLQAGHYYFEKLDLERRYEREREDLEQKLNYWLPRS